jgi:hypothetical protein
VTAIAVSRPSAMVDRHAQADRRPGRPHRARSRSNCCVPLASLASHRRDSLAFDQRVRVSSSPTVLPKALGVQEVRRVLALPCRRQPSFSGRRRVDDRRRCSAAGWPSAGEWRVSLGRCSAARRQGHRVRRWRLCAGGAEVEPLTAPTRVVFIGRQAANHAGLFGSESGLPIIP